MTIAEAFMHTTIPPPPVPPPPTNGHALVPPPPPPVAEPDELGAAAEFEARVKAEMVSRTVRTEAQKRVAKMEAQQSAPKMPRLKRLDVLLAEPDPPVHHRFGGLLPVNGRAVLAAQYKAGKTTLIGNALRSLVDHHPFLGRHDVEPLTPGATVALFDDEMDETQLRRWLRDQAIENIEQIHTVSLRGSLSTFDLMNEEIRSYWAVQLREVKAEFVIFDYLRPILDALGLNEDKDAGRFLVAFDALLHEAGLAEAIVVHHMGHTGERSRGDSRIRDWPDVEWRLMRQADDDEDGPDAPRFFSAFGRDVNVAETALQYDARTRRIVAVAGTRKDAKVSARVDRVASGALSVVTANPGISQRGVEGKLREAGIGARSEDVRTALAQLAGSYRIVMHLGANRSNQYYLPGAQPVDLDGDE